jgi:hypothetical protein
MIVILHPIDELTGIIVGARRGEDDLQRCRRARSGRRHNARRRKGSGIGGGSARRVCSHQEMELVRLISKEESIRLLPASPVSSDCPSLIDGVKRSHLYTRERQLWVNETTVKRFDTSWYQKKYVMTQRGEYHDYSEVFA